MDNLSEEIERIQSRLEALTTKKLEIEKNLSPVKWSFGDPELREIERQISQLENEREHYLKIIQVAAANSPVTDWSLAPLYSQTLKNCGYDSPGSQYKKSVVMTLLVHSIICSVLLYLVGIIVLGLFIVLFIWQKLLLTKKECHNGNIIGFELLHRAIKLSVHLFLSSNLEQKV